MFALTAQPRSVVPGRTARVFRAGTLCTALLAPVLTQASAPAPAPAPAPVREATPAPPPALPPQLRAPGFDLERLPVNATGRFSSFVESGDGLEAGAFQLAGWAHVERDPLVARMDGLRLGAIVGTRVTTHLAAGWAPTGWLTLGLQVPVVVAQGGDDLRANGVAAVPTTSLGAPVLEARVTVLRQAEGAPLDLGASLGLGLPLGSAAAFTGSQPALQPRVGAGRALSAAVRVGLELGADVRTAEGDPAGTTLSLAATASTLGPGVRGEVDVRGLVSVVTGETSAEVLAGGRLPLLEAGLALELKVGAATGALPGTPSARVLVGLHFGGRTSAPTPRLLEPSAALEPPAVVVGCLSDGAPLELVSEDWVLDAAVRFAFGEATVSPEAQDALDRVAALLATHPELTRLALHGHADAVGPAAFNRWLSLERARAVRDALVARGIDGARLEVRGEGEAQPLSDDDREGRPLNRRVEFIALRR